MYGKYVSEGNVIPLTAGAAYTGGTLIAAAGGVGLVQSDCASGNVINVLVKGVVEYACLSTDEPTTGATLYLDANNNRLTTTASTHTAAGKAIAAKAAGVTTVKIMLNEFSNAAVIAT